ncbi:unnamed protein product [Cuscuta campestris]|uniref:rhamnogalacturonan endolyase n=1 Tax=Cuscuta campestris TaxID=132261 RepID=A0A484LUZ3_9ASTE|nr:unnamed protein product [Cuscuta campestris]
MASVTAGKSQKIWCVRASTLCMGWRFFVALCCLLLFTSPSQATRKGVHRHPSSNWAKHTQELKASTPLRLDITRTHVVMDNGLVRVTLTNPTGGIAEIEYHGIRNVLESGFKETNRGYWDIVWSTPGMGNGVANFDTLPATSFRVITSDQNQIEVSFTKTYDPRDHSSVPLNIDKRYVMLSGQSGFYTYAIYEHLKGWPDVDIGEARVAIKLQRKLFNYMAISDDIQRKMPNDNDRSTGQTLDYKEAVLLTNPSNPSMKGEVDDKYQYSLESKDNKVHGWICAKPHVGFWVIAGGNEFRSGGPIRQDLTSHAGPTALSIFFSSHYAGYNYGVSLRNGEAWKKVFGPVFMYLNSDQGNDPKSLWEDAKRQMVVETKSWPYNFPKSEDYPSASQRGTITGRLLIRDRFLSKELIPAKGAYVGMAPPGEDGYWQEDAKGYQFWTETDDNGYFKINAVRSGTYNLYGWVPGVLGDYRNKEEIMIKPGEETSLGELEFDPPRNGPTIWEIGIPDRKAIEFFIPDPSPGLMNYALLNHTEKFRQYGLWDRYTDIYPSEDLVYKIGESDYRKDWFFAHVNRKVGDDKYEPATWKISFQLENVSPTRTYTLWIALAATNLARIEVLINNLNSRPRFSTNGSGRDNAIARHGIHGLYTLASYEFSGTLLVEGENIIYLRQPRGGYRFNGVIYDYIRLEGPRF